MYKVMIQTLTLYITVDELERFLVEEVGYNAEGAKSIRQRIDWGSPFNEESAWIEKA